MVTVHLKQREGRHHLRRLGTTFSLKGQIVKIFILAGQAVSVITIQVSLVA